ncbi:cobalamin biosynthesis protein CbiM [Nautilia sp. PV-1]|jgi:cobalt/nickel transport system permease protein|uniref:cobalt transporter CbiM n=1 Tax=Nautilia sp. PV-1 TaxID=2579250 RepID=UPI000FD9EDB3|nr:cobalt transporter CbiM [Nautilia sp. PV-1]AZV46419.1 cobalamin biosynthesis protein CbiM [Nautilia sp. PV-1]
MHIPDGYLSPETCVAAYAVAVPLWVYGFKKLKETLNEKTLPLLGAVSALSFVIMMFNIPVPGGTTAHPVGAVLISILFGPWVGYVSVSLVLLIQAIVFGDGGITTWAVNSLSMGFIGSFVGYYVFQALKNYKFSPFIAGYVGIVCSALFTGTVLGIQPIFWTAHGHPLYFPFDLKVSIPAMVIAHLVIGFAEGTLTQIVYSLLSKNVAERMMA